MDDFSIQRVIAPGEMIKRRLSESGWSANDLAEILDRPYQSICDLIQNKRSISTEIAMQLGHVFGPSAEYWLGLDANFRLAQAKLVTPAQDGLNVRARLYAKFPIRDMIKRGWIPTGLSIEELQARLEKFAAPRTRFAAKRVEDETKKHIQNAWLYRVYQIAKRTHVEKFSQAKLQEAYSKLKPLLFAEQEIRNVPRILGEAGIRFVVVQSLPDSKIDGVCFWLDNDSPVVAISLRYDRIDHFWFVLLHELKHVEHRHTMHEAIVDVNLLESTGAASKDEDEANTGAESFLVPPSEMTNFIARVRPVFSPMQVRGFSRRIGVHPGIIVGQLQHRGLIGFNQHKTTLVNIRRILTSTAIHDGWGMNPVGEMQ